MAPDKFALKQKDRRFPRRLLGLFFLQFNLVEFEKAILTLALPAHFGRRIDIENLFGNRTGEFQKLISLKGEEINQDPVGTDENKGCRLFVA